MRWQGRQQSDNVEDRRGGRSGGARRVGTGLGLGAIVMIIIGLLSGQDPLTLLQQLQSGQTQSAPTEQTAAAPNDELGQFVSVVLKDCEDVWHKLFREQLNREYQEPVLVLFSGSTESGCGFASAATGPFYCPADQKLYIDLSFYQQLKDQFRAPGDFAMAYVIAHEVAHHVQYLLGITRHVDSQRGRVSQEDYNQLSVRLELQADFLAGVWAHHAQRAKNILEDGDIEEALNAASAVGDDRIQRQSQGYVVPESFTHGTSEQRMRWFSKGLKAGNLNEGDTFNARTL